MSKRDLQSCVVHQRYEAALRLVADGGSTRNAQGVRSLYASANRAAAFLKKVRVQAAAAKDDANQKLAHDSVERNASREAFKASLLKTLARSAEMVSLRCQQFLPNHDARQCNQQLEAMQRAVQLHELHTNRLNCEQEKHRDVVLQATLRKESELMQQEHEQAVSDAGIIHQSQRHHARVAARVALAATVWLNRARLSATQEALDEMTDQRDEAEEVRAPARLWRGARERECQARRSA